MEDLKLFLMGSVIGLVTSVPIINIVVYIDELFNIGVSWVF